MKPFTLFLFSIILVASNCTTDYTDLLTIKMGSESNAKELGGASVDGVLIRPDIAKCLCCGGFILEVKSMLFKFDNFPASLPDDLKNLEYPGQYPIPVKVEFEFSRTCGETTYVSVSSIQRR
jgi:hypothetical protein